MKRMVYVLRHAQTEFNKKRIIQGSGIDSVLNEHGQLQAQEFYAFYKSTPFNLIYTSGLQRTRMTVQPFITHSKVPTRSTDLLNEINWGIYEGQSGSPAMKEDYQKLIREWQSGNFDYSLKGAESAFDLRKRLTTFLTMLDEEPYEKVLICSHGRTIRGLICLLKGESLTQMEKYSHVNTGLSIFEFDGDVYRSTKENDFTHLSGLT